MEKIKKTAVSSLGKTIQNETLAYIHKMNGQGVSNLHNLFITEVEKSLISAVLSHLGGNVTKTATYLGINRGTLIKRIKDYGISI